MLDPPKRTLDRHGRMLDRCKQFLDHCKRRLTNANRRSTISQIKAKTIDIEPGVFQNGKEKPNHRTTTKTHKKHSRHEKTSQSQKKAPANSFRAMPALPATPRTLPGTLLGTPGHTYLTLLPSAHTLPVNHGKGEGTSPFHALPYKALPSHALQ